MKIAIVYSTVAFGTHRKPFDFSDLEGHPDGLTGTDLVALSYARELAAIGHEVILYCHGVNADTTYDGVKVRDFSNWKLDGSSRWELGRSNAFDVAIAVSNPNCLKDADPKTLRVVNRQVAAFGIDADRYETFGFDEYVDLYTCPSQVAVDHVSARMPAEMRAKFRVLPNGCYPDQYLLNEPGTPDARLHPSKVAGRVAYVSSPDRGLHLLLEAWPSIRRRVPNAELRIYYQSLDSWIAFHVDPGKRQHGPIDEECTRRALYVRNALRRLEGHGVVKVGGVSHRELTKALCEAEVLAYPCDPLAFTETFSVAVLEACAAGATAVVSSADCLSEVHGHATAMIPAPIGDKVQYFADVVVNVLTNREMREAYAEMGREHAKAHDWGVLALKFQEMLETAIVRKPLKLELKERNEVEALFENGTSRATSNEGGFIFQDGYPLVTSNEKKRIDLVLTMYGSGEEPIDVDRPFDTNGGGGCRAGFMGLVQALPKFGYQVQAFANFKGMNPGTSHYEVRHVASNPANVVAYRRLEQFDPAHKRDVLLAYYDTSPLVGVSGCLRVASHHTFQVPCPGAFEWTDLNLAPSEYAVEALRKVFDDSPNWRVMPNAVQPGLPGWTPVRGRCLYHASPSRGLDRLLEVWPEIKKAVPYATLHVVGDVSSWLASYRGVEGNRQAAKARRVEEQLHRYAFDYDEGEGVIGLGIRFLGKLSRKDLLRELSEASCFPFPFEAVGPCETFSVSVMECLAVGVPVVMTPGDALRSIYVAGGEGVVEHACALSDFQRLLMAVLEWPDTHPKTVEFWARERREFAAPYTFESAAKALDEAIRERTEPGFRPEGVIEVGGAARAKVG